ncbi:MULTISPECIES: type IV toxin-antitoxin system AbiEi family antitoxin domain-containing protein [Microbacterium]|uniref:type IV toxin-antitoxin system AbiEi family antitoxin domain-containing protein n=1 Tax=Microbacterium TaxID=33882 RepID=UPI000D64FA08|nr:MULTISPECIES: type IV toxin-antitoxin system AbiEi family antitoxin domain-containing protein [Microbacterium]
MHTGSVFFRRSDLLKSGWTDRSLKAAVRDGRLLRARAGVYLEPDAPHDIVEACRLGGRLACTSALIQRGIFALDRGTLHVHLPVNSSRLRPLARSVRRHWGELHRTPDPRSACVELFDALVQAVRCQPARAAVATLDSAINMGALDPGDIDELFRVLPGRYGVIRPLLDGRCQSGPESLIRLMLRSLGVPFEVQKRIPGVGIVDFLVDGWLTIECDSRAHHSSWDAQRRDRRRDQSAAQLGLATFRPIAEDIMWDPGVVLAALRGLLSHRPSRIQENARFQTASRRPPRRVS